MKQKKHKKACHFEGKSRITYPSNNLILQPVEIVRLEDNSFHLITAVEINGVAGDMIIDTGASVTVIDQKLVPDGETTETNIEMQSGGVSGHISNVQVIRINKFKIGRTNLKDMQVAAIDLDYVNEMYAKHLNRKVVGLLGCDFCVKHQAIIDYPEKTLSWKR